MFEPNLEAARAAGLLDPTPFSITDTAGVVRNFILSKPPAIQAREIIAKYPVSNMPKLGDYAVSEEIMLKLMCFVAIELPGGIIQRLESRMLVDNHVGDWETLAKIEMAMMEKNCSFFRNGRISDFLNEFALTSLPKILKTLMASLGQSSQTDTQP
jgi:hypothetical protein